MTVEKEIALRTERINAVLENYLPKEEGYQKRLLEAMNYSVRAGGKRLRPMLMQESFLLFGGTGRVIEPFLAAIEWIHTYSLVHDDLPAMDNDEYRRGKKTTHAVYGEAMGILAGDALLNYAFETASLAFEEAPADPAVGKAFRILACKAGAYGMAGGQAVDVESELDGSLPMTEERLEFIYRLKTCALMEASMEIGAVLAGASAKEQEVMGQIAGKVGMAFQIQDDILDLTSTLEVLGKPIGSDEKNRKATYVALHGMERAKEEVERLSGEAVQLLEGLGKEDGFLKELIRYLIHREK